jgi:RNA polymerase sigma-70 factor (ECF subfamily)
MTLPEGKDEHLRDLMRAALAGDKRAYASALAGTAQLLRPYLSRRLFQKSEVEDVLQEILLSIHKARHTYDGLRPYVPWVFAIARYRLHDHLRAHYADRLRGAAPLEEAENISAGNVTETGLSYESISEEVRRLPEKQARILHLMHAEGYTAKEVAEKIGMKESAVKVAAHRAYKVLKKKLGE